MLPGVVLSLLSVGFAAGQDITADQFARLVAASLASYHDVTFLFEGRLASVPVGTTPEEAMGGKKLGAQKLEAHGAWYQGKYAYREDGNVLLEMTVNAKFQVLPTTYKRSSGLVQGRLTNVEDDMQGGPVQVTEKNGRAGSINEPYSPQRIVSLWLLKQFADPGSWNYQFLGWEDIGGHQCLKVELDQGQGWPVVPNRPVYRLWIDVARGGHPLRVEYVDKEGIRMRANGIELAEFATGDGKTLWFPVRGRLEMFALEGGRYEARVAGIESYFVLDDTLKINQGVPDLEFDVKAKAVAAKRLAAKAARPGGTIEGMKRGLEKNLQLAESQAEELRASASDEDPWWSGVGVPVTIGAFGLAALAGALWVRHKRA